MIIAQFIGKILHFFGKNARYLLATTLELHFFVLAKILSRKSKLSQLSVSAVEPHAIKR
jgi:hypothetical protein